LCSVFVLGYLYYTTKALTGVSVWLGFGYKSMLRALVEITLGAFCFECSRYLAGSRFVNQKKWRILLGCTEFFCFVGVICLIMLTVSKKYEFYALGLLVLMVIIAGSGMAYGAQWFDNRLCYFLGKLSLPIYLAQLAAIYFVNRRYTQWKLRYQMLFACVLTFVIAFGIMACAKPIRKVIDRFEHR
jgi:peptidoglycan/LPS O-acetylase OafA/YrhL